MRGASGRLVFDVDPELKRRLHAMVAIQGRSLKEWFLEQATAALNTADQRNAPSGQMRTRMEGER